MQSERCHPGVPPPECRTPQESPALERGGKPSQGSGGEEGRRWEGFPGKGGRRERGRREGYMCNFKAERESK